MDNPEQKIEANASLPPANATQKTPETRLKEISRKAKERKKLSGKKPTTNQKSFNPTWFYIGIGGATILGVAYLIFRESQTDAEGEVKRPPSPPQSKKMASEEGGKKVPLETIPEVNEQGVKNKGPQFELNSF